jgi:hypothetical protein
VRDVLAGFVRPAAFLAPALAAAPLAPDLAVVLPALFFAVLPAFPLALALALFPGALAVFPLCFFCGLRVPGRGGFVGCFRRAFPCGVFAPAVFRRPPPLRAVARRPAPALRFDGVGFCLRDLPVLFALFFFAILMPLKMVSGFDRWP